MNITIGADPELFLADSNGKFISAINKFGGTKDHPRPMGIGDGFGVLEDNVMVEFNIPPAMSDRQFSEHIQKALNAIEGEAKGMGLSLANNASCRLDADQLADWQAFVFGCEPDYCAYTGDKNPRPNTEDDPTFRSAGGHVHIGAGANMSLADCCVAVPFCDLFLGVPSVFWDTDTERKKLYGKAGAFRMKPYGFEYRTLSNFWIFNSTYHTWVYHAAQKAVEMYKSGFDLRPFYSDLQEAINNNNKDVARDLAKQFNLVI